MHQFAGQELAGFGPVPEFCFHGLVSAELPGADPQDFLVSGLFLEAARLTRRLREKWLDDFIHVRAFALWTADLLGVVLLDGQHFAKFLVALATEVFVKRHNP
jgi:hypothetical protein